MNFKNDPKFAEIRDFKQSGQTKWSRKTKLFQTSFLKNILNIQKKENTGPLQKIDAAKD